MSDNKTDALRKFREQNHAALQGKPAPTKPVDIDALKATAGIVSPKVKNKPTPPPLGTDLPKKRRGRPPGSKSKK